MSIITEPAQFLYPSFTISDYKRMEEDGHRYELINGILLVAPPPNRYHQTISRNLCGLLYVFLREHKIGAFYNAPFDVYLDDLNVVQPDVVFVARQSACKLIPEGAEGAPDWLVEILSPSTSLQDLRDKRDLYANAGVREFWVISPETRQLQIYRFSESQERPVLVLEEINAVESSLLPGLRIPVAAIFEDDVR